MVFEAYTFGIIWLLTSLSMEDEERKLYIVAWESVHFRPDLYLHCQYGKWAENTNTLLDFLFPVLISAYALAGKPQFMFMTVGIFLNVYILSNKLLDDFLALLLSVWFDLISCIFHLLQWSSYFFEGKLWDCSCLKKEACSTVTGNPFKWICNGNCRCTFSSWKSVVWLDWNKTKCVVLLYISQLLHLAVLPPH